ncbi:MAG: hypothetical protein ACLQU5_03575 [Isosphaeraceae bacterium]
MGVDRSQPFQKDLFCGARPNQGIDHDDREAAHEPVDSVSDVERQRLPDGPLGKYEDTDGGHHAAHAPRQGKPTGEKQASEDPYQRHAQKEEGDVVKGDDEERRHDAADRDRELSQDRIEARAGHAQCHDDDDENRREFTSGQMEKVSQGGGQTACQGRFQGVPDLSLAQRLFEEALPLRRGRSHDCFR